MIRTARLPFLTGMALLVAVICASMAACGGSTPAAVQVTVGPTPTVTAPPGLPVTIAIAGSFDDRGLALLDEQIADFEAANPDIKVEVVKALKSGEGRRQAFAAQLDQGDATRDIYVLSVHWLAEFAGSGGLASLDDLAGSHGLDAAAFLPASAGASTIEGRLMALPWTADAGLLYYRKDLLREQGLEPADTWDELQQMALDVVNGEGAAHGIVWQGAAYEGLTCNTLEYVWAHGGDVLDEHGNAVFDSVETRAGLEQMAQAIVSGASPAEVSAFNENSALRAFRDEGAVFMRNLSFAWDRLQGEDSPLAGLVGLAPLPATCLGGESLVLSESSRHPDEAFRFMAFLVAYEQQLEAAERGIHAPTVEAVYADAALLASAPYYADVHAALAKARPRPQTPAYAEISNAIFTEVNLMLKGEQDSATTASMIQGRMEEILGP
jgi:multiple sugar transport system substrate-binding protein